MWRVHWTPCYPRVWKVNSCSDWTEGDNFYTNFFHTKEEGSSGSCP